MKNIEFCEIDKKQLRENARNELYIRAKNVLTGFQKGAFSHLTEAYSDSSFGGEEKAPTYSREEVQKMVQYREEPFADDDLYDTNYNNEFHKPKDKVKPTAESEEVTHSESDECQCAKCTAGTDSTSLRMMKQLFYTESEEMPINYIDADDFSDTDEEAFRTALMNAQMTTDDIELSLEDGNTVYLNTATINKILASTKLFRGVVNSLDSLQSISDALGVKAPEITDGNDYNEFMESYDPDILVDKELLHTTVTDYISESLERKLRETLEESFDTELLEGMNNRNKVERGRAAIVNRVRGGKLQLKKLVSNSKGYKIDDGSIIRMKPQEIKRRRIGAKFASKKRRNQRANIDRKTKLSLRFRARRLGDD